MAECLLQNHYFILESIDKSVDRVKAFGGLDSSDSVPVRINNLFESLNVQRVLKYLGRAHAHEGKGIYLIIFSNLRLVLKLKIGSFKGGCVS